MQYNLTLKSAVGDDEQAVIPEGVTEIATGAFRGNTTVRRVVVPASCTEIGEAAFRGCTALEQVELPDTLAKMGRFCFCGCTALQSVRIPDGLKSLPQGTFEGCDNLASVTGGAQIERVEREAFSKCGKLADFSGRPLKAVEGRAFNECASLAAVDLADTVSLIGEMAFRGCTALVHVEFPANIIAMRDKVFEGCDSLQVGDEALVTRFPNAFPRKVAESFGMLRKIDRAVLVEEFKQRHAADLEELEDRLDYIGKRRAWLESEIPRYGVLDLKKRDALEDEIVDIDAESADIEALLAEIRKPSWDTIEEEFRLMREASLQACPPVAAAVDEPDALHESDVSDASDVPDVSDVSDVTDSPDGSDALCAPAGAKEVETN